MVILDIVLLLCFVPAVVLGLSKGLIKQLTELIAIVLGCWTAVKFTNMASAWASQYITVENRLLNIICFILIFIVVALIFNFLGEALTKIFKTIALGWLNRLLGMLFGIIKTAFIMGLIILLFEGINSSLGSPVKPRATKDSVVYNTMKTTAQAVAPSLKTLVMGSKS